MIYKKLYILIALFALLFASCNHKELCFHHDHRVTIRVKFDWQLEPDAHGDVRSMCVIFYPVDEGKTPVRFDFNNPEGGEVYLEPGEYKVITRNTDSDDVDLIKGLDDFETYEVYTRECNIFEPIYGNGAGLPPTRDDAYGCHLTFEPVYTDHLMDLTVTEEGVEYHFCADHNPSGMQEPDMAHTIWLIPEKRTATYEYEIRNVTNLRSVAQMTASMTGMCDGLLLGHFALDHSATVEMPFEAHNERNTEITGKFCALEYCRDHNPDMKLYVYMWLKDGQQIYYVWDVTEQVQASTDRYYYKIIIDGMDIPKIDEDEGGGFNVGVDDWGDAIQEDLVM